MAQVRTARLAVGQTGTGDTTHTCYTCPAGKTAIVKTVHTSNPTGTGTSAILAAQSGAAFVNLFVGVIASGAVRSLTDPYLVLEPGDSFVINSSITGGVVYWLSGVELDGVAP